MKLLVAVLLVAACLAPAPLAEATHPGCQPEYPCTYEPCDAKCIGWHAKEEVRCALALECLP